jgi:hypothetical protein
MRQGIAPWRGIIEAGVELPDFFLILDEPMFSARLLLEQAIKRRARVAGVTRRRPVIHRSIRGSGRRRGIARHRHHGRKEFAGVGLILHRNSRGHGLVTLKACGRIKMHALFAAMQRRAAFGAIAAEIHIGRQRYGAAKTARCHHVLYQPGKLGPSDIQRRSGALRLRAVSPE